MPGLCIGGTYGSITHLNTIRGTIGSMKKNCQSDYVSTETDYRRDTQPATREILYSFTHGVVNVSSTDGNNNQDDTQHIFLGLGLCSFSDFNGVQRAQWVQPSDLSTYSSYKLVFINACHSGDDATGYSDNHGRSSVAGIFKSKFPNAVYIAARGGNNGSPIAQNLTCHKCLEETMAKNMAVDFFSRIRDLRVVNDNRTFDWVKEQWDPEWDYTKSPPGYHPERSYYITFGGSTNILTVFP
ncbi:MAG TPA: hypothetical protein PK303_08270 [bacterium]|nr:hypothetical protein [bacterium]HOL35904.1 hypothetical protein [bacterium]HPP09098.1 hypothetical protein [bacterium]